MRGKQETEAGEFPPLNPQYVLRQAVKFETSSQFRSPAPDTFHVTTRTHWYKLYNWVLLIYTGIRVYAYTKIGRLYVVVSFRLYRMYYNRVHGLRVPYLHNY